MVMGLLLRAQHEHELLGRALEDQGTCNHVHTHVQPRASKPATLRVQRCHVPHGWHKGASRAHLARRGSRRRPATRRPLRPRARRCRGRQLASPRCPARAARRGRPPPPPARGRSPRATRPPRPWSPGVVLAGSPGRVTWHGTGMALAWHWHGCTQRLLHPAHSATCTCTCACTCAARAPCPPRRAAPA